MIAKLLKTSNCCCCFELRAGFHMLIFLEYFIFLLQVLAGYIQLKQLIDELKNPDSNDNKTLRVFGLAVKVILSFMMFVKAIYGTYSYCKQHPPKKVKLYYIFTILTFMLTLIDMILNSTLLDTSDTTSYMIILLSILILLYYLQAVRVVYSFWKFRIEEEENKDKQVKKVEEDDDENLDLDIIEFELVKQKSSEGVRRGFVAVDNDNVSNQINNNNNIRNGRLTPIKEEESCSIESGK